MTAELKSKFEKAAKEAKSLAARPSDDELLELYALYKQATVGNVSGAEPGAFDFTGRAKYNAWSERKGTSKEAAMQAYVAFVGKLKGKK